MRLPVCLVSALSLPACRAGTFSFQRRRRFVLPLLLSGFLSPAARPLTAQTAQQIRQGKRATAYVEVPSAHASATAFCISPSGFFVTNEHVVRNLDRKSRVTLVLNPGETDQVVASAHLVGADAAADLALLKLDGEHKSLAWLELDPEKEIAETTTVTAYGYPFGSKMREGDSDFPNITVNTGRITALRKSKGRLQRIQIDAPLHPGNSGSPVVDNRGKVVGIVEGGIEAAHITFAIPARRLALLLSTLSAMEVSLSPLTFSPAAWHQAQTFTIQARSLLLPLPHSTAPLRVELALNPGQADQRVFAGTAQKGSAFSIQAIPFPLNSASSLLQVIARTTSGYRVTRRNDQEISVAGQSVRLNQIKLLRFGLRSGVTLNTGQEIAGPIAQWERLLTDKGAAWTDFQRSQILDARVQAVDTSAQTIPYRLTAHQGAKLVAEQTGRLTATAERKPREAEVFSAPDQNSIPMGLQLFVSSFWTGEIKRYDARTGQFLGNVAGGRQLNWLHDLVFGPEGDLYACGGEFNSVQRFHGSTSGAGDTFVASRSGGLNNATGMVFGPDGNLYVGSADSNSVKRYNGKTGAYMDDFITAGSGGLGVNVGLLFSPEGDLYVVAGQIKRYDGKTGQYRGDFTHDPDIGGAHTIAFGPDGNLYVTAYGSHEIRRYDGVTGEFLDVFVSAGSGGLASPYGLCFGPDGNLYVGSHDSNEVKRYNGRTGAFMDTFAAGNRLAGPTHLVFGILGR